MNDSILVIIFYAVIKNHSYLHFKDTFKLSKFEFEFLFYF